MEAGTAPFLHQDHRPARCWLAFASACSSPVSIHALTWCCSMSGSLGR